MACIRVWAASLVTGARQTVGAPLWLGSDFLPSLSKLGRIFRLIMMSSNSFWICSSDSSTEPCGWGSGTDSGALLWPEVKLEKDWESEVVLWWCSGCLNELVTAGGSLWISGF